MPSEQQQGNDLGARGVKRHHEQPRCVRINLHDLKGRLLKVLGPKKDKEYCALFSSFLSQRLSKAELDERLLQTLGRDNIGLHNDIVKAVFRNATCGEVPPPPLVPHKPRRASAIRTTKPEVVEVDTRSPTSPLQVSSTPRRTGVSYEDSEDGLDVCSSRQDEPEEGPVAKRPRLLEEEQEALVPLYVRSHCRRALKPAAWRPEEEEPEEWLEPGMLPDAPAMQRRMERIAEGLEGVQLESANLLNHAVDAHLRRLIRSCIELVQARRIRRPKQQPAAAEDSEPISIIDFKVAIELNPRQLGEDWPLQLERISMRALEHHFG